jgi:photosystem II stability/assembly factor-like uncharacterized protein
MADMVYVGTDDGFVTLGSENGDWQVEHHGLKGWAVPAVAVVQSAPNCVLAATRGDGVWLSEDCGETWRKPCYGKRGPGKVQALVFAPRSGRLYAGCEPIDLFVSDDLGQNWERLDSVWDVPGVDAIDYPVKTVEPHVRDIAVDPQDPNTVYIALQVGYMLKSTDGGATWRRLDNAVDADIHTIAIDPADPATIVVATGGHDFRLGQAPGRALYRSTDAGESWTPVALEFPQEYAVPLIRHPHDSRLLYSAVANGQPGRKWQRPTGAETALIRSSDNGQTWQRLEVALEEASKGFPDAMTFADDDSVRLLVGYRSGDVLASLDAGDSWMKLDLRIPRINSMRCARV